MLRKNSHFAGIRTSKILAGCILFLLSFTLVNIAFGNISGSLLINGDFETGSISPWGMAISGSGNAATLSITSDAFEGKYAARISVTRYNIFSSFSGGGISFNSPPLAPTIGKTYTVTFKYKASNQFEAYFLCKNGNTQIYSKRLDCSASSVWKTASFKVGPVPSASQYLLTLRFKRLNTATIDDICLVPIDGNSPAPTPTPSPTPTPTPTPTPADNLATIPNFWKNPWRGIKPDDTTQGYGTNCIYPVAWQGQTCIKIAPDLDYIAWAESHHWLGLNEMDGSLNQGKNWVAVKPGDRVIFKAWIWVEPSTVGGNGGLMMAIDMYGASGRIVELQGNGVPTTGPSGQVGRFHVDWGSLAWKQLTIDFIVQETYKCDGASGAYSQYTKGQTVVPTNIAPWFQLQNEATNNERASAYVYGTELYVIKDN